MTAQDIVIRPVITEKSMTGIGMKKYTFEVAKCANTVEIAKAVEELFGVKVPKVNTMNVRGHYPRQGRHAAAPRGRGVGGGDGGKLRHRQAVQRPGHSRFSSTCWPSNFSSCR